MDSCSYFSCIILLLLISIVPLYHSQTNVSITQPTLTGITAVNSTALTINWQFASTDIDQSDLIRIYISIFEFYSGYNSTYATTNYTFTTNKTITSLTRNFQVVNAFYYICFSSNSTVTNTTSLVYGSKCQLARTCSRENSSVCPQASFVAISSTNISSSSFLINVQWLRNLPYVPNSTVVQLVNENVNGTLVNTVLNSTYTIQSYRFSNRQSKTTYTVNTIITYMIFNDIKSEIYNLTVTTSRSSNLFHTSDMLIFGVSIFSILLINFH